MESFIERENELIRRIGMQAPGWETKLSADYDPQGQRDADFMELMECTGRFLDYDNAQNRLANASRMACVMFPGDAQAQVDYIYKYDSDRKRAHNDVIDAIGRLNGLYAEYGMEPFVDMTAEQLHDPYRRGDITSMANMYVTQAKQANAEFQADHAHLPEKTDSYAARRRQVAGLAEADAGFERDARAADVETYRSQWEAVGVYDETRPYLYSPEDAKFLEGKDPDYVEHLSQRDADRAADRREEHNEYLRQLESDYGLSSPSDDDAEISL